MKKLIVLCLSLVLLMAALPVSAAATKMSFTVDTVQGTAGNEVTVKVVLKNNTGISSFGLNIAYDDAVLEVVSFTKADFASAVASPKTNKPLSIVWTEGTDVSTANGTVAIIKFKIKDDAELGASAVTLSATSEDDFFKVDPNQPGQYFDVEYDLVNGAVNVAAPATTTKAAATTTKAAATTTKAAATTQKAPTNPGTGVETIAPIAFVALMVAAVAVMIASSKKGHQN